MAEEITLIRPSRPDRLFENVRCFFKWRFYCIFLLLAAAHPLLAQKKFFGEEPVVWPDTKAPELPEQFKNENSDLQILKERTDFYFFSTDNEKVIKNVLIRINSEAGLSKLSTYRLPESFDPAFDEHLHKQGRASRLSAPITNDYRVKSLAARKFSAGKWSPVEFRLKYETLRWISNTGQFVNDQVCHFYFTGLQTGDIVEIYYEATFNANYGTNLFYLSAAFPKATAEYNFIYRVDKKFENYQFFAPVNIADSAIHRSVKNEKEHITCTNSIKLKNISKVNYPANSCPGKTLPHVFIDFSFYRVISNSYPTGAGRLYDYLLVRPRNFEWMIFTDTTNHYTRIYDKHFSTLRKFVATLPKPGNDSANKIFFSALCDTFNNFRFITANHLYYNESNLYDLYSSDHLAKRRLVSHTARKLYTDILNDNKLFYYEVSVQDKRLGEHSPGSRTHYAYEKKLLAIPANNSFLYFVPRTGGLRYHLNELPFYLEGALSAMQPKNFQDDTRDKESLFYKFIRTHRGTFGENVRTENVSIRISTDSLKAELLIKEGLSGQFSTILRPLYLNQHIDSTVAQHYFRKCTDKPFASHPKIRLSSRITEFPFKYNFTCSEQITLQNKNSIRLNNWFSFLLSGALFPETPAHDYYFDFEFSDIYNYLLDFQTPVEITNAASFSKNMDNALFELKSDISKQSESTYLLRVKLVVKESKVPAGKAALMMDLVKQLDELNSFSLSLAHK